MARAAVATAIALGGTRDAASKPARQVTIMESGAWLGTLMGIRCRQGAQRRGVCMRMRPSQLRSLDGPKDLHANSAISIDPSGEEVSVSKSRSHFFVNVMRNSRRWAVRDQARKPSAFFL